MTSAAVIENEHIKLVIFFLFETRLFLYRSISAIIQRWFQFSLFFLPFLRIHSRNFSSSSFLSSSSISPFSSSCLFNFVFIYVSWSFRFLSFYIWDRLFFSHSYIYGKYHPTAKFPISNMIPKLPMSISCKLFDNYLFIRWFIRSDCL